MKKSVLQVLKAVIVVSAVTAILLLILSLLLYKLNLSDTAVMVGIYIVYILSNFSGGYIIGKVRGEKKYIWGIIVGITFFIVLSILSLVLTGQLYGSGGRAVYALLACIFGGMAGGMCS